MSVSKSAGLGLSARLYQGESVLVVRSDQRTVWPVTVGYHETVRMLVAWCELRADFRNFRTDRVVAAEFLEDRYPDRPSLLRARWRKALEEERRRHHEAYEARRDSQAAPAT